MRDGTRLTPVSASATRKPPASAPANRRSVMPTPVMSMPMISGSDSIEKEKSMGMARAPRRPPAPVAWLLRRVGLRGRRHRLHLEVALQLVDGAFAHPLVVDAGQLARLVQRGDRLVDGRQQLRLALLDDDADMLGGGGRSEARRVGKESWSVRWSRCDKEE